MKLQLHKPLIIFDLETTGVQVSQDRIVELYMIKANPDGREEHYYKRLNPRIPIPEMASSIHGIFDKDVIDCPTFQDIAHDLNRFIGDADFGGYNSNRFDFPLLVEEFYRAGVDFDVAKRKFIDAQRIYHIREPRNLAAAYRFYCDRELQDAHSAEADTLATWEIIKAQLEKYEDLTPTVEFLHKYSGQNELLDLAGRIRLNQKGEAVFAFGKHKDKSVIEVFQKEPGYYDWMMQGDFPENTKRVITRLRLQSKTV
ncbi:MAG: 3'-5' exonuclease [Flavobacteriales bacterium]|nr:3'-5' exonuclease [Flavobacteriales bacterium]